MDAQKIIIPDSYTNLSLEAQVELGEKASYGDNSAREKLILCCVPLVKNMANSTFCRCYYSFDDAFQDGMIGALKAVDLYDYTRQVKFTTFAFQYIHQSIVRGVVKHTPVKVSERDFFNSILLSSTSESFQKTYQVLPTDEQLSKLTSIPLKDIALLRKRKLNNMLVSLDDEATDPLLPVGDFSHIVDKILKESTSRQRRVIGEALKTLSENEREIIEKRYLYTEVKATMRELAKTQNVSHQMIAKREKVALKKLLLYFAENNIKFDDIM